MAAGEFIDYRDTDVPDGKSLIIDPADSPTDAVELNQVAATGAAELLLEIDVDGDGTYEMSFSLERYSHQFYDDDYRLKLAADGGFRARVENRTADDVPIDIQACGTQIESDRWLYSEDGPR